NVTLPWTGGLRIAKVNLPAPLPCRRSSTGVTSSVLVLPSWAVATCVPVAVVCALPRMGFHAAAEVPTGFLTTCWQVGGQVPPPPPPPPPPLELTCTVTTLLQAEQPMELQPCTRYR